MGIFLVSARIHQIVLQVNLRSWVLIGQCLIKEDAFVTLPLWNVILALRVSETEDSEPLDDEGYRYLELLMKEHQMVVISG